MRRPRQRKRPKLIVSIPLGALLLLYLFSYFSQWIDPRTFWPAGIAGLGFTLIFLATTLVMLLAFFSVSRWRWVVFVIWLPGFLELGKFYQVRSDLPAGKPENCLRIVSFNVRSFDRYRWLNNDEVPDGIVELLRELDADVICFQEFFDRHYTTDSSMLRLLMSELQYPYYAYNPPYSSGNILRGPLTLSRFPIINRQGHTFSNGGMNGWLIADLQVRQQRIRVVNFHLASYSLQQYQLYPEKPGDWPKTILGLQKLRNGFNRRSFQVEELKPHLNSTIPLVVAGDLNDTPHSYAYEQLSDQLLDAFMEAGKGQGKTYAGKLPSFRIDYLFSTPGMEPMRFEVIDRVLSDHYPVMADLKLPE